MPPATDRRLASRLLSHRVPGNPAEADHDDREIFGK